MNSDAIFYPLLAQVLIVLVLYILLTLRKKKAAAAGQVDESRRGLFDDAWPPSVIQVNNCIRNQFELPVLFCLLVLVLWTTGGAGSAAVAVAWLFILSRVLHAWIHTGSNHVPHRRKAFTFGCLMVMLLFGMALYSLLGR